MWAATRGLQQWATDMGELVMSAVAAQTLLPMIQSCSGTSYTPESGATERVAFSRIRGAWGCALKQGVLPAGSSSDGKHQTREAQGCHFANPGCRPTRLTVLTLSVTPALVAAVRPHCAHEHAVTAGKGHRSLLLVGMSETCMSETRMSNPPVTGERWADTDHPARCPSLGNPRCVCEMPIL